MFTQLSSYQLTNRLTILKWPSLKFKNALFKKKKLDSMNKCITYMYMYISDFS